MAITIDATAGVLRQWPAQVGRDRSRCYTRRWLDYLAGADIHNASRTPPGWQDLSVGDGGRLVPRDSLWGIGEQATSEVLLGEPGRVLVLEMFGSYVVDLLDQDPARLLARGVSGPSDLVQTMIVYPIVFRSDGACSSG